MLECKILTSDSEIESIATEWQQLQGVVGRIPYTDYAWFDAWWRHIGKPKGKVPFVVIGRINQKLVAVLALSIRHKKGMRILQGVGVEASCYCDVLSESPGYAMALWETVRQSRQFDFALIRDVDSDSGCGQALASFARRSGLERVPYLINTWVDGKAWQASLDGNLRRNNQRRMRRLQEKGEVRYYVHTTNPVPAHIIDGMIQHKIAWGIEHKIQGIFNQKGATTYFLQLSANAAEREQLHLSWLQCGDRIVVYSLGFFHGRKLYLKMLSYDPTWLSFSPGNLITVNVVSWAIENGCREINFGLGDNAYKLRYANNTRNYSEWIFGGSCVGQLMVIFYFAYQAFQRVALKIGKRFKANFDGKDESLARSV